MAYVSRFFDHQSGGRGRSAPHDPEIDRYLRSFPRHALIQRKEYPELMRRYHAGTPTERRQAKDQIVYGNIGLVIKIAKRLAGLGIPLHELIQEGLIGLMHAIDIFDVTRGNLFGTCAQYWILQGCLVAFNQEGCTGNLPFHLSYHLRAELSLVKRAVASIPEQERESWSDADAILAWIRKLPTKIAAKMTKKRVERALRFLQMGSIRLDAPVGAGNEATVASLLSAEATDVEGVIGARRIVRQPHAVRALLQRLLARLPARSVKILQLSFGLDGNPSMTLVEIGTRMGLSRERIRQIREEALRSIQDQRALKPEEVELFRDVLADLASE